MRWFVMFLMVVLAVVLLSSPVLAAHTKPECDTAKAAALTDASTANECSIAAGARKSTANNAKTGEEALQGQCRFFGFNESNSQAFRDAMTHVSGGNSCYGIAQTSYDDGVSCFGAGDSAMQRGNMYYQAGNYDDAWVNYTAADASYQDAKVGDPLLGFDMAISKWNDAASEYDAASAIFHEILGY